MTNKMISQMHGAAPSWKVAALVAFALALGLLAWRGKFIVMPSGQNMAAHTASEVALFNIIEPVVGAANMRVAVTRAGDAGRTVTVLLNETVGGELSRVRALAKSTLAIDPAQGDTLSIETAAFAVGAGGATTLADYIELCGLALLAGLTGWIGLRPHTTPQSNAIVAPAQADVEWPREREPAVAANRGVVPPSDPVSSVAKADPARAANVIRGWMSPEGAA